MLTVLGARAEFECNLVCARTGERRESWRGAWPGRKLQLTPRQRREAIRRRAVDGKSFVHIARWCNVSRSTISRVTGEKDFEGMSSNQLGLIVSIVMAFLFVIALTLAETIRRHNAEIKYILILSCVLI